MTTPAHADEHESLIQLLAKSTSVDHSKVAGFVLITVGEDGRPMVGSDLDSPEIAFGVMYQLLVNAGLVENVHEVEIPEGN